MPTICRHIKTNGIRCKALSLTGGIWCYFHQNRHQRHPSYRHTKTSRNQPVLGHPNELTALEDREAVQVALSFVINALAAGRLETKRATALLYGLQLASQNARTEETEDKQSRNDTPLAAKDAINHQLPASDAQRESQQLIAKAAGEPINNSIRPDPRKSAVLHQSGKITLGNPKNNQRQKGSATKWKRKS